MIAGLLAMFAGVVTGHSLAESMNMQQRFMESVEGSEEHVDSFAKLASRKQPKLLAVNRHRSRSNVLPFRSGRKKY